MCVATPTSDRPIRFETAGMVIARSDAMGHRPTGVIVPPTKEGPVGLDAARVLSACIHLRERARGRRGLTEVVPSPASDGPIALHSAGMKPTAVDLGERARRGRRLTIVVGSPAGERAIRPDPARMIVTCADLRK